VKIVGWTTIFTHVRRRAGGFAGESEVSQEGRVAQMPSHVSMMRLTACATRAGGRGNPSAPVR
jgi:hypothetical protein